MADSDSGSSISEAEVLAKKYGPACRCGVTKKPPTTLHGIDDGKCYRHPETKEK